MATPRLTLTVNDGDGLDRVLEKSPDACCLIVELADDLSPRGWECASRSRTRESISVRELISRAARQLEDEVPDFMRDLPEIREQVRKLRELLLPEQRTITIIVEEPAPSEPFTMRTGDELSTDLPSRFRRGGGVVTDTIGYPGLRPEALPSCTLKGVSAFMRSDACKRVIILTGAGISTNSGIADYRSTGGLYESLDPTVLSASPQEMAAIAADPEHVARFELFRANPLPFLEVKRAMIQGLAEDKFRPTCAHALGKVLERRGLLSRVITQNIDGLHSRAGLSEDAVLEAHGTARYAACSGCGARVELGAFWLSMKERVKDISEGGTADGTAPLESTPGGVPCPDDCGTGSVKPAVVLFGQPTDPRLTDARTRGELAQADLVIIAGTSLLVPPFNQLPELVRADCVRVVLNANAVGERSGLVFGNAAQAVVTSSAMFQGDTATLLHPASPGVGQGLFQGVESVGVQGRRDVLCLGDIDESVAALCAEAGWLGDLETCMDVPLACKSASIVHGYRDATASTATSTPDTCV